MLDEWNRKTTPGGVAGHSAPMKMILFARVAEPSPSHVLQHPIDEKALWS